MNSAPPGRSTTTFAGAFLTLLAWIVVAPQAARSECSSHYLPTISLSIGSEAPNLGGLTSSFEVAEIPDRPKPCTGEMCSGRPTVPLSPAPIEVYRVGSWAILVVTTRVTEPDPQEGRFDLVEDRPIDSPAPIFHPPRPSRSLLPSP
ncbi:hypothetical protein P12x_002186 [Tundrisphaera lichenicola]|uniref:hypothetical protein n=1 Tax=Tundrisphaera lichenicola TaxID=2029860 RepID=UPI003EB989DB